MSLKIVSIIPARMAATRFPNKPLAPIKGLPMIEHVRRRALLSENIHDVYVATCDVEIKDVVEKNGGKAIITSDQHERCTDRIAEAAKDIECDVVVNVQGDEPLLQPRMLDEVVAPFLENHDLDVVNLLSPITEDSEFNDANAPKVVLDRHMNCLYMSREAIPSVKKASTPHFPKYKQLGIMAFRSDFLQKYTQLEPTPLEEIESIDMLRCLEHGYSIRGVVTEGTMIGVDIPSDVERVEIALENDALFPKIISQK